MFEKNTTEKKIVVQLFMILNLFPRENKKANTLF